MRAEARIDFESFTRAEVPLFHGAARLAGFSAACKAAIDGVL